MVVVLQRRVPPLVVVLIAAVFVTSLVAALDARAGGALYDHLALVPMHVWRGQVWRLVTWVLVERSPVSLLFAAIALYRFGGDLVLAWGQGRFGRFVAAIVLIGEELLPQKLQAWERFHGRILDWVAAEPGSIGCSSPSSLTKPRPETTKMISSFRSWVCSRMKQPGATVCVPMANGICIPTICGASATSI